MAARGRRFGRSSLLFFLSFYQAWASQVLQQSAELVSHMQQAVHASTEEGLTRRHEQQRPLSLGSSTSVLQCIHC